MRKAIVEAGASVADLGTLVPIFAALVVGNGVDAAVALVLAGVLAVGSAAIYRVPIPVQPIKAAAAIAIATGASARVIAATGFVLGAVLVVLGITGAARYLVRLFPKPVIRGNQLGVGILLVFAAAALARADGDGVAPVIVAAVLVGVLVATERARRVPVALALVAGGVAWSVIGGARVDATVSPFALRAALPAWDDALTALTLLVIPQLPLTLGNAVVGTADIARDYFGRRAARVTEARLSLTSGLANVGVGLLGGIPLCHGSSGTTAYHRFGARTGLPILVLGVVLVVSGALFGAGALDVLALIPGPVLAALLAYTGVRHALLVADLRGGALAVAVAMGAAGALTRNLTVGMAVGLPLYWILAATRRIARA